MSNAVKDCSRHYFLDSFQKGLMDFSGDYVISANLPDTPLS